jgi:hypothetical protein
VACHRIRSQTTWLYCLSSVVAFFPQAFVGWLLALSGLAVLRANAAKGKPSMARTSKLNRREELFFFVANSLIRALPFSLLLSKLLLFCLLVVVEVFCGGTVDNAPPLSLSKANNPYRVETRSPG